MPQEQHRATSRVLDLLELLSGADGTGYTLTELSQALDIPKSSLFPILHTLEQRRYVLWDKRSGQYSIGVSAYVLGASFPAQRGLVALRHVMQEVVDRCQETCQLGVLDQGSILYLEKVDSPQAIRLISRVGDRLPANATALGKALLSGLSDDEVQTLWTAGLPRLTSHTVTELPQLLTQLAQIRRTGIAFEREECAQQLACWAVPLRRQGRVFAALSVSVPLFRCTEEKEALVCRCLLEARDEAEQLAESRGFSLLE